MSLKVCLHEIDNFSKYISSNTNNFNQYTGESEIENKFIQIMYTILAPVKGSLGTSIKQKIPQFLIFCLNQQKD